MYVLFLFFNILIYFCCTIIFRVWDNLKIFSSGVQGIIEDDGGEINTGRWLFFSKNIKYIYMYIYIGRWLQMPVY